MTDKDKIKFAIHYLKQGLKSKRTPPLYEELMKELGFVSEKELGKDKVIKDLEWQIKQILEDNESYQKENAELKAYNEKLLDGDIEKHNKIVELKEQVDALANVNIKAQNIIGKAKEIIKRLLKATYGEGWNYSLQVKVEAEKFLKEEYK